MATSSARRKSQAEGAAAPKHPEVKRDILPIVHVRTSTSDVTASDFFLMSTTLFSDSLTHAPEQQLAIALDQRGAPGRRRVGPFDLPESSSGSTLYLTTSINQSRCSSCSCLDCFDRSLACVQSVLPS
jgi:hypothetical protein